MKISHRASIVWILTGLNLFNYLDRYVATAVSPKIAKDFNLTDWQTTAIISAFMLGYFVTSPVFGALGDRYPRKGLIAGGVLLWSLATAASGLATGFGMLIIVRILVGIGEASYATLSPTIIDDVSEPRTKNKWLALFFVAIPIGTALGYGLGGWMAEKWGWPVAFFIAGAPGILLAGLVLLIDEPPRKVLASSVSRVRASPGGPPEPPHGPKKGAVGQLLRLPMYRNAVLGYTAYTFALGAFAGVAPLFLERSFEMEGSQGTLWLGIILASGGLLGTAIGGWLGDRYPGEDRARAYLKVCAIVSAIAVPFSAACLLARTPVEFFVPFGICGVLLFTATAPINAAILKAVPEELRASAMAVSIFSIHLFGDFISPQIVGGLSDLLGKNLRAAMGILPVAIAIGALVWWHGSRAPRVAADGTQAVGGA